MRTKTPRIEQGRGMTKLIIPHEDNEIRYVYPSFGPNTYQSVGEEILKQTYKLPYAHETASLLHALYCSELKDKIQFQNVRQIMHRGLWIFNIKGWHNNGVYTIFDPRADGISKPWTIKELEKKLKRGTEVKGIGVRISEDGMVRFAPREMYRLGEHTSDSLAKDGNIISEYGLDGAEKLGEVAAQFEHTPHVSGFNINEGQDPLLDVSSVSYYKGRLYVGVKPSSFINYGHAFGIL